jgi:hypothetical protein
LRMLPSHHAWWMDGCNLLTIIPDAERNSL